MAHGRRPKAKPANIRKLQDRLHVVRNELVQKYGNLYGMRLDDWFVFNGHTAVFKGKDKQARKAIRLRFYERLEMYRNSKGTSAGHTARRKKEQAA